MLKISQKFKNPENIVATLIVLLIPFWNIPHTIAIRYSIALILLIAIFYFKPNWKVLGKFFWLPAIWIGYLLIYTFLLADNFQIALKGFRGEWLKSIIFMIIGLGSGLILSRAKDQAHLFLVFGLASLFPILTHIYLFTQKALITQSLPFGYWGLHEHHADLGYTALQTITFLTMFIIFFARNAFLRILSGLAISLSILSPILARSRAGVIFTVFALLLNVILSLKSLTSKQLQIAKKVFAIFILLILGLSFGLSSSIDAERWGGLTARLLIGFHGNPIEINCFGTQQVENELKHSGNNANPKMKAAIDSLNSGDGARTMTARAGIQLIKEFPMGMSGNKDAYAAAIRTKCVEPKINMDHTHNGWIDTALSIGIPGVLIYAALMMMFIIFSFKLTKDKNQHVRAWALVLLSLSIVWSLRAIFDSVQRDQMLEIQSFFLPLAMACIIGLKSNSNGHNGLQT
jgi:O-Antigen ligase